MGKPTVDHGYFLKHQDRFPWDWFHGRPTIGPVHGHICRLLALVVGHYELSRYLSGNPSMMELKRLSEADGVPNFIKSLYNYCENLYSLSLSDRKNLAGEVLYYIKDLPMFTDMFAEKLNKRFMEGAIRVPDETLPPELLELQNYRLGK